MYVLENVRLASVLVEEGKMVVFVSLFLLAYFGTELRACSFLDTT